MDHEQEQPTSRRAERVIGKPRLVIAGLASAVALVLVAVAVSQAVTADSSEEPSSTAVEESPTPDETDAEAAENRNQGTKKDKSKKKQNRKTKSKSDQNNRTAAAGADLASINLKPLPNRGGKVYRVRVNHRGNEEFGTGIVQMWLPNGIKQVRGLYVPGVMAGSDPGDPYPKPGGNREHVALTYHFGVVSTAFTHRDGTGTNHEAYCEYGSGAGMLRAFRKIAKKSGHPEIATAPFMMYGYSLATMCINGMAMKYPKRMILFSAGGLGILDCSRPGVKNIPMIYVGGNQDGFTEPWPQQLRACRKRGTPIAYAMQNAGHGISDDRPCVEPWWWSLIPKRLPANVGDPLIKVDKTLGYLANNQTKRYTKFSAATGNKHNMSWLPSKAAAKAWVAWQR